jgi:hypothetical protein
MLTTRLGELTHDVTRAYRLKLQSYAVQRRIREIRAKDAQTRTMMTIYERRLAAFKVPDTVRRLDVEWAVGGQDVPGAGSLGPLSYNDTHALWQVVTLKFDVIKCAGMAAEDAERMAAAEAELAALAGESRALLADIAERIEALEPAVEGLRIQRAVADYRRVLVDGVIYM